MEKRMMSKTGLNVSVLGYGAMALRAIAVPVGPADTSNQGSRVLHAVLDAGINLIDTSPDYGNSEDIIGAAVPHRRNGYVLASKCGGNVPAHADADAPRYIWTKDRLLGDPHTHTTIVGTKNIDHLNENLAAVAAGPVPADVYAEAKRRLNATIKAL